MSLKTETPSELQRQAKHRLVVAADELAQCKPLRAMHVIDDKGKRVIGRREFVLALENASEQLRLLAIDLRIVFDDLKDHP